MLALGHNLPVFLALAIASKLASQPALREYPLSALPNFLHSLHSIDSSRNKIPVVLDGNVPLLGELGEQERRVDNHLLAACGTVGLGPFELARLALHLKVLVTFRAAESELPRIIADKSDTFGRVDWP